MRCIRKQSSSNRPVALIGRAADSKSAGWGFKSLLACQTLGVKMNKVVSFFSEVYTEIKKIVWPTRTEVVGSAIIVCALVVICGMILGGMDAGFSSLIRWLIQ